MLDNEYGSKKPMEKICYSHKKVGEEYMSNREINRQL